MNRKYMPSILMLTAGAITCIISFVQKYELPRQLLTLLIVLVVFYALGSTIKWTLDYFEAQNEQKSKEEGEVIAKESDAEQPVQETKEEQEV